MKQAAVSLVHWDVGQPREDERILVVWNRRHLGWSLPGGLAEEGETVESAQARELEEETGLQTVARKLVYEGPVTTSQPGRASYVVLFEVETIGEPREMEAGCLVRWMTPEEFLAVSPFTEFYRKAFATRCVHVCEAGDCDSTCAHFGTCVLDDRGRCKYLVNHGWRPVWVAFYVARFLTPVGSGGSVSMDMTRRIGARLGWFCPAHTNEALAKMGDHGDHPWDGG
jgi:ADP-ribose pyrophosphatase YjhB (NUDIX family)